MNINGYEVNFDVFDVESMEAFGAAARKVDAATDLREQCNAYREGFVALFGEEDTAKILPLRMNLRAYMEIFYAILDEQVRQIELGYKEREERSAKIKAAQAKYSVARVVGNSGGRKR